LAPVYSQAPELRLNSGYLEIRHSHWIRRFSLSGYGRTARVKFIQDNDRWVLSLTRAALPGMARQLNLQLIFFARHGRWMVALQEKGNEVGNEVVLTDWLADLAPLRVMTPANGFPGQRDAFIRANENSSRLALFAGGDWTLLSSISQAIEIAGTPFAVTSLSWSPPLTGGPSAAWLLTSADEIASSGPPSRFRLGDKTRAALHHVDTRNLSIKASHGPDPTLIFSEGQARLQLGNKSPLAGLHLQRARLVQKLGGRTDNLKLLGELAPYGSVLTFADASFQLGGHDGSEVALEVIDGQTPQIGLTASLQEVHIGIKDATYTAWRFPRPPIDITLGAARQLPPEEFKLSSYTPTASSGDSTSGPVNDSGNDTGNPSNNAQLSQTTATFQVDASGSILHVSRAADLLDLKFGFFGFSLKLNSADTPIELTPVANSHQPPMFAVHFPPQHRLEEAIPIQKQKGTNGSLNAGTWQGATFEDLGEDSENFKEVVETRASAPTRVVYQIGPSKLGKAWPLDMETLLRWNDLSMVVSGRAMPKDASLEQQLAYVGITKEMGRARAMELLRNSVERDRDFDTPNPAADKHFRTAIEPRYREVLSPSAEGAQLIPVSSLEAERTIRGAQLFSARLAARSDRRTAPEQRPLSDPDDLRVIWVRGVNLGFLYNQNVNDQSDTAPWSPDPDSSDGKGPVEFVASVSMGDLREQMTMTSIYALMALRRLVKTKIDPNGPDVQDNWTYEDDPNGQVRAIAGYEKALYNRPDPPKKEAGFIVGKTLPPTQLVLTSLGAHYLKKASYEPPAPWSVDDPKKQGLNWGPALRVERAEYESNLGRDILVSVAYKGFLFPFGHRASLLKVTEREVHKHASRKLTAKGKDPTAYLVQRRFIVVGRPRKTFPAVGQPFGARAAPAKGEINLLTTRTPDLLNPEAADINQQQAKAGRISANRGLMFWPRVKEMNPASPGSDVRFEFKLDGEKGVYRTPLLFVDNTAAHDATTMKALVDKFRSDANLANPATNIAQGDGTPHAYAPTKEKDATSYETRRVVLSASGVSASDVDHLNQLHGQPGEESFKMTAIMEGADQPPFYPVLQLSFAKVQSLDRFVGRQHGEIRLRPNAVYIAHGFEPARNPRELFLDILDPLYLDLSSDGTSSGGLAKPNSRLVGLSRSTGPVGGRETAADLAARFALQESQKKPVSESTGVTTDSSAFERSIELRASSTSFASNGNFDPQEFFGGALSDAKLLGLINLKDVLKVSSFLKGAPKMLESTAYEISGQDIGIGSDATKERIQKILNTIDAALEDARQALIDAKDTLEGALKNKLGNLSLRDLYPGLIASLDAMFAAANAFSKKIEEAATLLDSLNFSDPNQHAQARRLVGEITASIGGLVGTVKAVITQVELFIENPVPKVILEAIDTITTELKKLRGTLENGKISNLHLKIKAELKALLLENLAGAIPAANDDDHAWRYVFSSILGFAYLSETELRDELRSRLQDSSLPASVKKDIKEFLKTDLYTQFENGKETEILRKAYRHSEIIYGEYKKEVLDALTALAGAKATSRGDVEAQARKLLDKHGEALFAEVFGLPLSEAYKLLDLLIDLLTDNATDAKNELTAKIITLLEKSVTAAVRAGRLNEVSQALKGLTEHCKSAANYLTGQAEGVIADFDKVKVVVVEQRDKLAALSIPDQLDAIHGARTQALVNIEQMLLLLKEGKMAVEDARARLDNGCGSLAALDPITHVIRLQLRAVDRVNDIAHAFDKLVLEIRKEANLLGRNRGAGFRASLTSNNLEDLEIAIGEALMAIVGIGATLAGLKFEGTVSAGYLDELGTQLKGGTLKGHKDDFGKAKTAAQSAAASLQVRYQAIAQASKVQERLPLAKSFALEIAAYAATNNKTVARLLGMTMMRGQQATKYLKNLDENWARPVVEQAFGMIKTVNSVATDVTDFLLDQLEAGGQLTPLGYFVSDELINALKEAQSAIVDETKQVDYLIEEKSSYRDIETKLVDRWRNTPPASLQALRAVSAIADLILQGQLDDLISFERFKDDLEDAVKSLIPARINLSYDWSTRIGNFPDGRPIFAIKEDFGSDKDEYFKVQTQSGPQNIRHRFHQNDDGTQSKERVSDLVIEAGASIHLLTGERESHANAYLHPYVVHILPGFDIVTLHMRAARFGAGSDQSSDFDTTPKKIELGDKLQYIKALSGFLSGGGDQGPYYEINLIPLELEVGYRFSIDVVPLGALMFYNIAFHLSAELPLDSRDARFRFTFASRERPFIISVPPYGGGGFVGFTANPKSIIGFEASIEFGAIVGIDLALIKGYGQITAGVYIQRIDGGKTKIAGFVRAFGHGSIAIFSITVNIEIGLEQEGSRMTGYARYSFSFKVSFVEVSYEFGVTYAVSGDRSKSTRDWLAYSSLAKLTDGSEPDRSPVMVSKPSRTRRWTDYRRSYAPETPVGAA
jgi:hypothetical protein